MCLRVIDCVAALSELVRHPSLLGFLQVGQLCSSAVLVPRPIYGLVQDAAHNKRGSAMPQSPASFRDHREQSGPDSTVTEQWPSTVPQTITPVQCDLHPLPWAFFHLTLSHYILYVGCLAEHNV